jgi:hypothetical protein
MLPGVLKMRRIWEPTRAVIDELWGGSDWLELERMGAVCWRCASEREGGGCGTSSLNRKGSCLFCLRVHGIRSIIVKWESSAISGGSLVDGSTFVIYF